MLHNATSSQITLNDFESFDNFLFGDEKRDWGTFFDYDGCFIAPITNPVSIVQHQLCHYAYWMTIAKNHLSFKPHIVTLGHVTQLCYACKYAQMISYVSCKQCSVCPLKTDKYINRCGSEHWNFIHSSTPEDKEIWAEKIAKIIWFAS